MNRVPFTDEHMPAATVVGLFERDPLAEAAAHALRQEGATDADAVIHDGRLVFLVSAQGDETRVAGLERALRQQTDAVLLEWDAQEKAVTLFGRCLAPDEATAGALQQELSVYFGAPYYFNLPAPWEEAGQEATAEARRAARMQATLGIVNEAVMATFRGPDFQALAAELLNPANLFRLSAINEQIRAQYMQSYPETLKRLAGERGLELDDETMATFEALQKMFTGQDAPQMQEIIGRVVSQHRPRLRSGVTGFIEQAGRALTLDFVMFHRIAFGLPAMLDYLKAHGCTAFDYRLEDFDDVRGD